MNALPLDLDRLPIAELKTIYEVLTGKRKPSVHLIPVLTRVIDWGYETFLANQALPIGAASSDAGELSEAEAVLTLLQGPAVVEEAESCGIDGLHLDKLPLTILAVRILIKAAQRLLNEVLDGE